MRQSWFNRFRSVAASTAVAVLALLLTTASAPAQSRNDSGRNDADSSSAGDRDNDQSSSSDRSSSRSDQDHSSQSGRSARRSSNQLSHPMLGVLFYSDENAPLEVRRVMPGTPAEEAGLERGDEIISVDGRRVSNVQQLRQQIERIGTDEDIEFGVLRDGRQKTITARLTASQQSSAGGHNRNQQPRGDQQYGYNQGYQQQHGGRQHSQGSAQQRGSQEYGGSDQGYGQWVAHPEYDRGFWDGYAQAQHELSGHASGNQRIGNQNFGGQSYLRGSRGTGNWQGAGNGQGDQSQSSNRYTEGYRGSRSNQGFLGVTLDENDRNAARVNNLYPNSPAEEAGIRPGDEIVAINDDDVRSSQDVKRLLGQKNPDEDVAIEVNRNGRQRTLHATLTSQQQFFSSNSGSYRMGRRTNSSQQGDYNDNRGSSRRQQNQNQNDNEDQDRDNY
jgi:membrane-associated protease RseP (regulator of RpoE activity)